MKPFRRRRRGGIATSLDAGEAHLLANLAGQVIELLRDRNGVSVSNPDPLAAQLGMGGPSTPPEDPVLRRLLPDAYRDAVEDAAEFRRFTEQSLTAQKVAHAEALIASLVDGGLDLDVAGDLRGQIAVEVELGPESVQSWLKALTDIRLAVAVRLGVEDSDDAEDESAPSEESDIALREIYDWLGYVQESLVVSLG